MMLVIFIILHALAPAPPQVHAHAPLGWTLRPGGVRAGAHHPTCRPFFFFFFTTGGAFVSASLKVCRNFLSNCVSPERHALPVRGRLGTARPARSGRIKSHRARWHDTCNGTRRCTVGRCRRKYATKHRPGGPSGRPVRGRRGGGPPGRCRGRQRRGSLCAQGTQRRHSSSPRASETALWKP
jgi:hypothetical protein